MYCINIIIVSLYVFRRGYVKDMSLHSPSMTSNELLMCVLVHFSPQSPISKYIKYFPTLTC